MKFDTILKCKTCLKEYELNSCLEYCSNPLCLHQKLDRIKRK